LVAAFNGGHSAVAVHLLLSDEMTYSTVACASICMDYEENIIPLLFTGYCLLIVGSRDHNSCFERISHSIFILQVAQFYA
jgi:hypothetical protein